MTDIDIPADLQDTLTPLDEIHPYPDNPKSHPDAQLDDLAGRIRKDGWDQSIVVDSDGEIVKGHARYRVARDILGMAEAPVVWNDYDSEADKRAARIHDNRVQESGEWDDDLLAVEVEFLDEAGVDVAAETGMGEGELDEFVGDVPDFEPVPEDEQPRLDETDVDKPKWVTCPECSHEFEP